MYHHPIIRQAIWLLKFNKKHSVLGDIEEMLQKHFSNFLERHKFTHMPIVLVPIPLTKKSKAKRGYNQSTHIAKLLAKSRSDISVNENILKKTINHKPQNKIKDRSVRLTNIQSSFTAHIPEHAKNITIILIDDVITTGATLNEARKTLIRSGAKKVYGFSLAH